MFNIIYDSKVHKVYSVKSDKKGTYFLIYSYGGWKWVSVKDCRLLETLKG